MIDGAQDIRVRLRRECPALGDRNRANPPDATVARWSAAVRWERWGITRLGRLTGLDRLGLPVWMSVRPNARTLAVCQGKGLDDAAAAASALMEAIEIATAERLDLPCRRGALRDLRAEGHAVDPLPTMLRRGAAPLEPDEAADWLPSIDLFSGRETLVPADAVLLDDTRLSRWWRSSDGLASGNILAEAVLHALSERIERDAMALWGFTSEAGVRARCVDPIGLDDDDLLRLTDRIAASGFLIRLFDITTDVGVPCFFAVLVPREIPRAALRFLDVTSGSGCHPVAGRAAIRAVTEAVQSRLTKIAAARDDFDPALYDDALPPGLLLYADCEPSRGSARHRAGGPDRIADVLTALAGAGIHDCRIVVLADEPGLAVVKAVVPGLESLPGERAVPAGPRLLRQMMVPA